MTICSPSKKLAELYENQLLELLKTENMSTKIETMKIEEHELFENIKQEKYDLIISNFSLQSNESIEESLESVKKCLYPDGVILGVVPGAQTLRQLRNCYYMADNERNGGFEERMVKTPGVESFGNLLHKQEWQMASVYLETVKMKFENSYELLEAIKNWGLGDISFEKSGRFSEDFFLAVCAIYSSFFNNKETNEKVDVDFELLKFIGYKVKEGQIIKKKKEFTIVSFKDFVEMDEGDEDGEIKFGFITETDGLKEIEKKEKRKIK